MSAPGHARHRRAIAIWLLVCCGFVAALVLVGGWTRLTNSGLSMVEWRPVTGFIPPLSEAAWMAEFQAYQQTPEFRLVHSHFGLEEFKTIYWFEFTHRLLGRLTGLVFAVPLAWFLARRAVTGRLTLRLLGLLVLGGLQGFIGWWMVKSGLVDRPDVSAIRLAVHLGMAFLLFSALLWTALDVRASPGVAAPRPWLGRLAIGLWVFALVTAISGALVAGLDGGFTYNTFPLMGDRLVPAGLLAMRPVYLNPFENPVTAQFNHRLLAMTLVAAGVGSWLLARRLGVAGEARRAANALAIAVLVQASLGVATLLSVVWLPLASAHQLGALVLLGLTTWLAHSLRQPQCAEARSARDGILPDRNDPSCPHSEVVSARP